MCERDATLAVEVSSVVAEQDAALAAEDAALAHRAALAAAVLVLPMAEPVEADGQGGALALVSVMPKAESRVPDGQEAVLACFVMPKAESKVPDGQEAALAWMLEAATRPSAGVAEVAARSSAVPKLLHVRVREMPK